MPKSVEGDQSRKTHAAANQQTAVGFTAPADHAVETSTLMLPEQQQGGGTQAMVTATNVAVPALPVLMQDEWDRGLASLKVFKEQFGHTNVSPNDNKGLADWIFDIREQYRYMMSGQALSLTADRVQQLQQLGLTLEQPQPQASISKQAETRGRSKDEETWKARLGQLKQFHSKSGHFRVPVSDKRGTKRPRASTANESLDPETVKLGKWVKRQRRQYATDQLSADRVAALTEIGFDFKPGNASKSERLEIQLGLLDSLRQRREFSNAQVADLNFLYDEWKRRGDEDKPAKAVHVSKRNSDGQGKFDIKWMEKFEELKEFKANNGHTRVPQVSRSKNKEYSEADKAIRALAKWVDYQRQCYWKLKKGQKAALTSDRIAQLESIGFEWRIRVKMPLPEDAAGEVGALDYGVVEAHAVANPADMQIDNNSVAAYAFVFAAAAPRDEQNENMNDYKWNCRYQELFRYRQQFGTARIAYSLKSHDQYFQELSSLSKWADMQRTLFQKRKKGEKTSLTKERIKRLEDIDFDFTSTSGKAVDFRGWNAKLQKLKEYKARFGHTRVPARKKKPSDPDYDPQLQSLAKWVEHQRGMYWKRARGEKNALSDERITALEAIGMEWRLVHTVSRPRAEMATVGALKTAESDQEVEDHVETNQMSADALADTIDAIDSIPAIPNMGAPTFSV